VASGDVIYIPISVKTRHLTKDICMVEADTRTQTHAYDDVQECLSLRTQGRKGKCKVAPVLS